MQLIETTSINELLIFIITENIFFLINFTYAGGYKNM